MLHRSALFVLILASASASACGGGHAPRAAEPAPVLAQACPTPAELEARLRDGWQVPDDVSLSVEGCIPGRFGEGAFYVVAVTRTEDDSETMRHRAVLGRDGTSVLVFSAEEIDFRSDIAPPALLAFDLDGDGQDEVLEEDTHHEGGVDERWLTAYRIAGGRLDSLGAVPTEYDDPGAQVSCEATVELRAAEHAVVLHATVAAGEPGDACLPAGDHALALRDGKLAAD